MVIALIPNIGYEIKCEKGKAWWAIKASGQSLDRRDTAGYGEKITFVAQGDAYYHPWIQLQNVNQR